jgi:hypothetical protein
MIGRREFAMAGVSALAYAALEGTGLAQQKSAGDGHQPKHCGNDEMLKKCATACSDCQRACDSCATHCAHLVHSGKKDHFTTLMTCQDCADFCVAASQMVARGGPFMALICKACEEACARCGKECEKFPNDQHMKQCAEECRKCEKACREMVAHAGHGEHQQ